MLLKFFFLLLASNVLEANPSKKWLMILIGLPGGAGVRGDVPWPRARGGGAGG